jgi:hypothetical protein
MTPEIGRAGIQIGCFLVVPSSVLLFFLEPGTAEWNITVLTLIIGVVFLGIMIALTIRAQR